VRFPSGAIDSQQWGLVFTLDTEFVHTPWQNTGRALIGDVPAGGVGFDRVVGLGNVYGATAGRARMGGVGVRMLRDVGAVTPGTPSWRWVAGVEALGAASGGADGYAEGLVSWGTEWAAGPLTLGARAAIGLAGGGGVGTAGGRIGKVGVYAELPLGERWLAHAEAGQMAAAQGGYRPHYLQLGLGYRFDRARPVMPNTATPVVAHESWGAVAEAYAGARRKTGEVRPMKTWGIRLDHYLSEHTYVSGQAHSGVDGGAGAYSIGLFGIGYTAPLSERWSVGAEGLVGAAGGGGVAVQGGAVVRPGAYLSYRSGQGSRWLVGAARLRARSGQLDTAVTSVQWLVDVGVPTGR
jgi:hypothetical protein